jgi:non-specific serine/threonine protein kinase/serine/threonine-protein kinase
VEQPDPLIGTKAGPYQIISKIGEGGMAVVYRAVRDDEHYKAQVAVKVLRRGLSSSFIIERFRNERQILARQNHPNIARLLDGGTTAGERPYFVMELVDGTPLDDYCDAHKLSTSARLKLFRQVCGAVQYAHSNLIVHRDLKPTNILITTDGSPKLLDFGIAKVLTADTAPAEVQTTMAAVRLMTPEYASPEQVRGDPITTATDVYALGVVLFELLTGHHPFQRGHPAHELERMIREADPEKPSTAVRWTETVQDRQGKTLVLTPEWVSGARDGRPEKLVRRLRGDLDNIVLRAMRKNPQERYESAGQLSEDIRRHLDDEPVMARPASAAYRAGKFAARHRTGVMAAALIAAALFGGGAIAFREARQASAARERAERRFNDVRHLATSFLFEFHDAIRDLPGSTEARALVVRKALAYLDSLSREVSGDASLERELAEAYERVADVQGSPGAASLGDTAGAAGSLRRALELREKLARANPSNADDQLALASAYGKSGQYAGALGDTSAALERLQKAFRIREQVYAAHSGDLKMKRSVAVGYWELGVGFAEAGAFQESLKARLESLRLFEELHKVNPTPGNLRSVALLHKNVSATLNRLGRVPEALAHSLKAVEIDERRAGKDIQSRKDLAFSYGEAGDEFASLRRLEEALAFYKKSQQIRKALAEEDAKDFHAQVSVANMEYRIASVLAEMGRTGEAEEAHRRTLAMRESLAAKDTANAVAQVNVAQSHGALGEMLEKQGDRTASRVSYERAFGILDGLRSKGSLPAMYAETMRKAEADWARVRKGT